VPLPELLELRQRRHVVGRDDVDEHAAAGADPGVGEHGAQRLGVDGRAAVPPSMPARSRSSRACRMRRQ
jgi:hypothetical protein